MKFLYAGRNYTSMVDCIPICQSKKYIKVKRLDNGKLEGVSLINNTAKYILLDNGDIYPKLPNKAQRGYLDRQLGLTGFKLAKEEDIKKLFVELKGV